MRPALELEHTIGFSGYVNSICIHPNGTNYIYSSGACVVIADINDPHNQTFLKGHDDDVTVLALSRSGRLLASGQKGSNADVCVWDVANRALMFRLDEHDEGVTAVAFSDDEKLLVTVGDADRHVVIWDMSVGLIVSTAVLPVEATVTSAAWGGRVRDIKRRETNTYQFALVAGSHILCYVLDPFGGTLQHFKPNLGHTTRNFTCVQYDSEGDYIFLGSSSGDVSIYSVHQHSIITATRVCSGGVLCLVLHPQAKSEPSNSAIQASSFQYARMGAQIKPIQLYISGGDGSIATYTIKDIQQPHFDERGRAKLEGQVVGLSLHPSGTSFLAATGYGTISRVNLPFGAGTKTGTAIDLVSENPLAGVAAVCFHPSANDRFATASLDAFIRVWDTNNYRVLSQCGGASGGISRVLAKPFGGQEIGGGFSSNDYHNGTKGRGMADAGADRPACSPSCMAFLGNMDILISGWSDGAVRAYDALNGEHLWSIDAAHRSGVSSLCIAPSLKFFITGGDEGEIRLWGIQSRELLGELKEHKGRVTGLSMFDDGTFLLSCSRDKAVLGWDLTKQRRVSTHEQRMGSINSLALFHNQSNFLTVGLEKRVTLWDLRESAPVRWAPYNPTEAATEPSPHYATTVALSPEPSNRYFMTGGTDQLVRLWDTATLTPWQVGAGHSGTVTDVAFSPDVRQAVSVGTDSCVFVWNIYD